MREKVLYVKLSDREEEMMRKLMEELGFEKPSEYIRYLVRREWEKLRLKKCQEEEEGGEGG